MKYNESMACIIVTVRGRSRVNEKCVCYECEEVVHVSWTSFFISSIHCTRSTDVPCLIWCHSACVMLSDADKPLLPRSGQVTLLLCASNYHLHVGCANRAGNCHFQVLRSGSSLQVREACTPILHVILLASIQYLYIACCSRLTDALACWYSRANHNFMTC